SLSAGGLEGPARSLPALGPAERGMSGNLVASRLQRRASDPMREHDLLPQPLRLWAAEAALPWSASSLRRIWAKELARQRCPQRALARLSRIEAATLARDCGQIWGKDYPLAR